MYDKLLQVDLPNITFLKTVYLQTEAGATAAEAADSHHAYLILSTAVSTMVLETKEELELVTDKMNFVTDAPTLCAGNILSNSKIVQVYGGGVRVMSGAQVLQNISAEEMCAELKLTAPEVGEAVRIKAACICDPFVVVLMSEGTLFMLSGEEPQGPQGKVLSFGGKVRRNVAAVSTMRNDCAFFGTAEADLHLAFACDAAGTLEVLTLPDFSTVFQTGTVCQGHTKLVHRGGLATSDEGTGAAKREEKESPGSGESVVEIDCQVDKVTSDVWLSFMISDGFFYIYKLEGTGPAATSGCYFRRRDIMNEFLLKAGTSSSVPRKIVRIENVNSHSGYFVTGDKPFVVFLSKGQARIYSALRDGPITSFTPFHNVNCRRGFVFSTQTGVLNVCNLSQNLSTTYSWCAKVSHFVGGTVHKVAYSQEARVLAALVSKKVPYRPRKPEEGGGDAHATNVYAAQEAAIACQGVEEAYEVHLVSLDTFESLWSHTLGSGEVGLSISAVYIKNEVDQSVSSLVAVGTAVPRGEDYPCRGHVHLFKIEKQDIPNAEVGQPSVKWGAALVTSKDFRGAPGGGGVNVVSCLDGCLLAGIGMKILMFKWNGQHPPPTPPGYPDIPQLEQCGFFDSTLFAGSFATVKKFVLCGDRMKGIHFLRWLDSTNQNKVLQQLSHDYQKPPIHHVQFLIDGSTLTIMAVDMHGNLRIYAFDPADPLSLKGKRLLGRAIFHLGAKVSRVLRITAKANTDASTSPAVNVSRKIGTCLSTYDASLGMVLPLDETTYKRLRSLQTRLVTATVQPAGLNPLAHRHAHWCESFSEQMPTSDKVVDGKGGGWQRRLEISQPHGRPAKQARQAHRIQERNCPQQSQGPLHQHVRLLIGLRGRNEGRMDAGVGI